MNLSDEVILITGAGGSLGQEMIKYFHPLVSKIIAIDINEDSLQNLKTKFSGLSTFRCDVTKPEDVERTLDHLYQNFSITCLINNAGRIHSELLINLLKRDDIRHDYDQWHNTINLNLNGVFYMTVNVVAKMVRKRIRGTIINISSIAASGNSGQSSYAASKAAINALTVTWSKELGPFGIRVAAIAPGFIQTESTASSLDQKYLEKYKKETPLNRLGSPKEVVEAVRFIIENGFYNGKILELDGGLRI